MRKQTGSLCSDQKVESKWRNHEKGSNWEAPVITQERSANTWNQNRYLSVGTCEQGTCVSEDNEDMRTTLWWPECGHMTLSCAPVAMASWWSVEYLWTLRHDAP